MLLFNAAILSHDVPYSYNKLFKIRMSTGIILDNGGGLIKAAKLSLNSPQNPPSPLIVPNALAKPAKNAIPPPPNSLGKSRRPPGFLAAAEILQAPDVNTMTLRRPLDRGVVTQWDLQRDVWASIFSSDCGISLSEFDDSVLLVTEALAVPLNMRFAMDELVFEEFSFGKYCAVPPQRLAAAACGRDIALVLDSGFSFTHAVPVIRGIEHARYARRLNLGGKVLTNLLKEMVSFRSLNMMDETVIMSAVKERLCYVSLSFLHDLERTRRPGNDIVKEYVLPDFSRGAVDPTGHMLAVDEERDGSEQVLVMNNERICVPEALFHPSDVGLQQAGVAELIFQAVQACPEEYHADLYANVVLTGGNCKFPNFRKRVAHELRPLVCDDYDVDVCMDDDPILTAFHGGVRAFTGGDVPLEFVSKDFYFENGSSGILRKFYGDDDHNL